MVTLPVIIFEPMTMLQRMAEVCVISHMYFARVYFVLFTSARQTILHCICRDLIGCYVILQLMEYSYLLDMADETDDPYMRLVYACKHHFVASPSVSHTRTHIHTHCMESDLINDFCSIILYIRLLCLSTNMEAVQSNSWRDLWNGKPWWHVIYSRAGVFSCLSLSLPMEYVHSFRSCFVIFLYYVWYNKTVDL
jgi:hypothetical protein